MLQNKIQQLTTRNCDCMNHFFARSEHCVDVDVIHSHNVTACTVPGTHLCCSEVSFLPYHCCVDSFKGMEKREQKTRIIYKVSSIVSSSKENKFKDGISNIHVEIVLHFRHSRCTKTNERSKNKTKYGIRNEIVQ